MDPAHHSVLTGVDKILTTECPCCAMAQGAAEDRGVTGNASDGVVIASRAGIDGLLVVPRQHVNSLEELSIPGRGLLLATLRRATQLVRGGKPGSSIRVVVSTFVPASPGHVCFHVRASTSEDPTDSSEL